jgi:thiol:disulfide interchange protein DsbD
MGVALVLLSALIGGLLLNLMPCVFPVLAMKALALVDHAKLAPRERVAGGLAYTAGVLACFLILGAVLLALKAGGAAVGWGFQLQNPALVALLAYVLFVAGLNLSGVFEFGGSFMGVGSSLASRSSMLGSFFTGMLAAVVATPCSAPFMAPAIGVALTQPAAIAMLTFVVLGLGLALPYLLLSFVPAVARALPKPGRWMGTLKQVLAFPMYASAAWMVWVLAQQAGADGVLEVLLGMTAVAFALWLWGLRGAAGVARAVRIATVAIVLLASVGVALRVAPQRADAPLARAGELSEPFTAARLEALRAAGKPIFVNLTAAWCITCKVNERLALSGPEFRSALRSGGYTYLKGDWTQQNPEITQVLSSFGRAGVPLYLVFPAHGAQAMVLPQLLTEAAVVQALNAPRS